MIKKITVISIAAVFLLVAITFSTAVSSIQEKTIDSKESPLFGIRTNRAIENKLSYILENIKTNYIGKRVFFLPFLMEKNCNILTLRQQLQIKSEGFYSFFCAIDCLTDDVNCP